MKYRNSLAVAVVIVRNSKTKTKIDIPRHTLAIQYIGSDGAEFRPISMNSYV